jgi:hypothetical protein
MILVFVKCLILCLALGLSAGAQKPKPTPKKQLAPIPKCLLTATQAPEVRGLKLGQPIQDMNRSLSVRFDGLIQDRDLGFRETFLTKESINNPEALDGVSSLHLVYMDDKLVSVEIHYSRDVNWQSNLHFAAAIADSLNLPRDGWRQRDPTYLDCDGFYVKVSAASVMPTLEISIDNLSEEIDRRAAEFEVKKRAKFKP